MNITFIKRDNSPLEALKRDGLYNLHKFIVIFFYCSITWYNDLLRKKAYLKLIFCNKLYII